MVFALSDGQSAFVLSPVWNRWSIFQASRCWLKRRCRELWISMDFRYLCYTDYDYTMRSSYLGTCSIHFHTFFQVLWRQQQLLDTLRIVHIPLAVPDKPWTVAIPSSDSSEHPMTAGIGAVSCSNAVEPAGAAWRESRVRTTSAHLCFCRPATRECCRVLSGTVRIYRIGLCLFMPIASRCYILRMSKEFATQSLAGRMVFSILFTWMFFTEFLEKRNLEPAIHCPVSLRVTQFPGTFGNMIVRYCKAYCKVCKWIELCRGCHNVT